MQGRRPNCGNLYRTPRGNQLHFSETGTVLHGVTNHTCRVNPAYRCTSQLLHSLQVSELSEVCTNSKITNVSDADRTLDLGGGN